MSFAVVHMQKFKRAGVNGIQFHNQRERESKTNPDIDRSRSHENYDVHNRQPINYNKRINEIIESSVVTNRAIRKDAVVMCNFVVTSDHRFFMGMAEKDRKRYFKQSYKFFAERYGKDKIVASTVHLDERTPHMHLSLVPVTEDKKLSAKRLFDRVELKQIQTDYVKHMQNQGFDLERGIDAKGQNKHLDTQKFKEKVTKENLERLGKEVNGTKNELESLKKVYDRVEKLRVNYHEIEGIEGKYGVLNKGKVKIDTKDFEHLKDVAKREFGIENKLKETKRENYKLKNNIKELKATILGYEDSELKMRTKLLEKNFEIDDLKETLNDKQAKIDRVKNWIEETDQLKDFIKYAKDHPIEEPEIEIETPEMDYELER